MNIRNALKDKIIKELNTALNLRQKFISSRDKKIDEFVNSLYNDFVSAEASVDAMLADTDAYMYIYDVLELDEYFR